MDKLVQDATIYVPDQTQGGHANVTIGGNGDLIRLSITKIVSDEDGFRFSFADLNIEKAIECRDALAAAIAFQQNRKKAGYICHVDEMKDIPEAIYIGRANPSRWLYQSAFHNPFKIGPDQSRYWAVDRFRSYLKQDEKFGVLLSQLPKLRGKPLACWCRHSYQDKDDKTLCHGDVLLEYLEKYTDEELLAFRRS